MKKQLLIIAVVLLGQVLAGCNKYLEEKPDKKLVVPSTLTDMQSILDAYSPNSFVDPGEGEVSSDDYYLTDAALAALSQEGHRRLYTWQKGNVFEARSNSWYYGYTSIYSANAVLAGLTDIRRDAGNQVEWDNLKGQALLLRGKNLLQMAFLWTPAYDEASAGSDLGLPLRLNTDFNEPSVRASNLETYQQILSDLRSAAPLLPVTPLHPIRASRPAAYGLLARAYLSMRKYSEAGLYADSCLQLQSKLIDYNTLTSSAAYPLVQFNDETILFSVIATPAPINPSRARVVPEVYNLYAANDLRKTVFFRQNTDGSYAFKGNYTGQLAPFGGVATDEMVLIRAEAAARQARTADAMADLNRLLKARLRSNTYTELTAANAAQALSLVLLERRKELLNRGLRWMDLKRLNIEGANITLRRTVGTQSYTLPPNDGRYALAIPEDVIALTGMPQNP